VTNKINAGVKRPGYEAKGHLYSFPSQEEWGFKLLLTQLAKLR